MKVKGNYFSVLNLLFLALQTIILLLNIFNLDVEFIKWMDDFLTNSDIFFTIIFLVNILFFFKSENYANTKWYNLIFAVLNIVLLNDLYSNTRLQAIQAWFADHIGVFVFLCILAAIACITGLLIYRSKKKAVSKPAISAPPAPAPSVDTPPEQAAPVASADIHTASAPDEGHGTQPYSSALSPGSRQSAASLPKRITDTSGVPFGFIITFAVICMLCAGIIFLLARNVGRITQDIGKSLLSFASIAALAIFIIAFIFIVFKLSQYLYSSVKNLPEYVQKMRNKTPERMLKIFLVVVLVPILMFLDRYFKISTDTFLNWLTENGLVSIIVSGFIYILFALLIVETIYALLHYDKHDWLKDIYEGIIKTTLNQTIRLCKSLVIQFFRLVNFIPDFIETLEEVMLDEKFDENEGEG